MVSLLAFFSISLHLISKYPNDFNNDFMSLTGNIVLDLDNFVIGNKMSGNILINEVKEGYGILLLTKGSEKLFVETFYLPDYIDSNSIELKNLVNYTFEESGDYELFLSALELNINIKKEFVVSE